MGISDLSLPSQSPNLARPLTLSLLDNFALDRQRFQGLAGLCYVRFDEIAAPCRNGTVENKSSHRGNGLEMKGLIINFYLLSLHIFQPCLCSTVNYCN
jgi:hypothetical protein